MRVLVAADMEGITGIDDFRVCSPPHWAAYNVGCELMTDEVLVAVAALRDAGIDDVVVGDWHMVGANIRRDRLPADVPTHPIADLVTPDGDPSISTAAHGPVDAAVLLGQHASGNSKRGFSSHTLTWGMSVFLDGLPMSEAQIFAQAFAAEETPVLVVAGDDVMLEELGTGEFDDAQLIPTKRALDRARAVSVPTPVAHDQIAAAISRSVEAKISAPPLRDYPAELVVTMDDEELLRRRIGSPEELLQGTAEAFMNSKIAFPYRVVRRIFPAHRDSDCRSVARRLCALALMPIVRRAEVTYLADAGLTAPGGAW